MTSEHVIELAKTAGLQWGGLAETPRLIRNRENVIFEVSLKRGGRAAMRLHRQGYQSAEAIKAELVWTAALVERGFPCPEPVPTQSGDLVYQLEDGPLVSLVTWIDADPIGENDIAYRGPASLYEELGGLIGRLHLETAALELPEMARPSWDANALLGETPHWGRFWENPSLRPSEVDLLQDARKNAAQHFERSKPKVHLIHADLLQENILRNHAGLWLIDFDDSGYGYGGYDLATSLIQHENSSRFEELAEASLMGYSAQRGIDALTQHDLSLYVMLRSMASCGWITLRADEDDPRQRFYAERAIRCTGRWLQG